MTRAQESTMERLANEHGRVHVGRPDALSGSVQMTLDRGESFHVAENGAARAAIPNHSIYWRVTA